MNSKILHKIEKIFSLNNEIENFQQGKIDEDKRERGFQINKLSESIDKMVNKISLHNKWKETFKIISQKEYNDILLSQLQEDLNKIEIVDLNSKGLLNIENQLSTYFEKIELQINDIKISINEKLKIIKTNIEKSLSLIQQFSNIPEIKLEIDSTYHKFFESSYNEKEVKDSLSILNQPSVDKLIEVESAKLEYCCNLNNFSDSLYNILDFNRIGKKFEFNSTTITNLRKIIDQKKGIKLCELDLTALTKIKKELPQFYKKLYIEFK